MKKAILYLFIGLKSDSLSFYWTITSGMVGRNVYRLV